MADDDRSSKTEAPTPRRLEDARRKGDVAKSQDVPAFMAITAAACVLIFGGQAIAHSMIDALIPFIAHPDSIDVSATGGVEVMRVAMKASAPAIIVLAVAALAGIAGNVIQHGLLWAPDKLAPDFSKLNPLSGFKRIFGVDALIQFFKSVVKIISIGFVAWWILRPRADQFSGLSAMDLSAVLPFSMEILKALCLAVLLVLGIVAGADWLIQRQRFMARMRMSREEVKQDNKEADGDPYVKARQKQLRVQRSKRRMMQNLPKATVVVMNPTHYAVALRYVSGENAAPVCVAKGLDSLALKIRAVAESHGVPVVEDPPLARALYASIEIDEAIPREQYQAVAKIIGFVMGGAQRGGGPRGRAGANEGRPARL